MGANSLTSNSASDSGMQIRPLRLERSNKAFNVKSIWPTSYPFPWTVVEAHGVTGSVNIVTDQSRRSNAKWDKTLASPESIAYEKKVCEKIERDIATGNIKNYISDDHLEELF